MIQRYGSFIIHKWLWVVKRAIADFLFWIISEIISDIGTSLFYQFCGAMDDNVMNYQPTLQFFTSCVEILGKVSADYDDPGYTWTGMKRSGLSSCFCNEMLFPVDSKSWFSPATESESELES